MTFSALDRCCEKYGCAKVWLDPKLHSFDDCFGGKIRMGDLDGAVERNGCILWMEWKRGALLENFDRQFSAQFRQARAFTMNSDRQTFVFVLGDPSSMEISAFRVVYRGRWLRDWEKTGMDGFRTFLRRWFAHAEKQRNVA
jgi:hypothetical protein